MTAATQSHRTVQLIGCFRLLKALLLFSLAFGALKLLHKDVEAILTNLIQSLDFDPDTRLFQTVLKKIWNLQPKLPLVLIGSVAYGVVFCVEGVGLILERRWAEYLTVVITSSFLPIEIYEMIKHGTWIKVGIIVVNIAIVIYLILRLRYDRHR